MGNGVQNLVPVADPAVDCEPTPGTLGYSPGAPTEYWQSTHTKEPLWNPRVSTEKFLHNIRVKQTNKS